MKTLLISSVGLAAAGCLTAFGGTVITNNLPPNTAIVNISGTQDGAASYGGNGQAFWYQPFFTSGATQLLEYTITPGTYSFRVVDPADAAQMFPNLSSPQLAQIFTAWTYNSPWIEDYVVFDSAAATNSALPQIFDGAPDVSYGSPQSAYDNGKTNKTLNVIRLGPLGRAGTNSSSSYTTTTNQTLIFVVPDYDLADNGGGVSVVVAPVPALFIAGGVNTVTLTWATNAPGFNLKTATNVQSTLWTNVTTLPSLAGTNYAVTLPLDSSSRFFRLSNP